MKASLETEVLRLVALQPPLHFGAEAIAVRAVYRLQVFEVVEKPARLDKRFLLSSLLKKTLMISRCRLIWPQALL